MLKHLPRSNFRHELLACESALRRASVSSTVQFRCKVLKTTNLKTAWVDLNSDFVLVAEFSKVSPKPALVAAMRWTIHCRYKSIGNIGQRAAFRRNALQVDEKHLLRKIKQNVRNTELHCPKKQRRLKRNVLSVNVPYRTHVITSYVP